MPQRINRAIELLEQGQPVYYTGAGELTYENGRAMAKTWADYITIDMEHGAYSIAGIADVLAVSRALPFTTFVRIPELSKAWVSRVLDAGAGEGPYAGASVVWTHEIMPNESIPNNPQISTTADGIILCDNTRWVLLDDETGLEIDSHAKNCQLGLRYEPIDDNWENCDGTDDVAQDWAVNGNRLEPIPFFRDGDQPGPGDCTLPGTIT